VLVAAWRRPEFLLISLVHALEARWADDHEFIFILDHGHGAHVRAVVDAFPAIHKRVIIAPEHEFYQNSNSFNVLEGYRYAHMVGHKLGSKLVYLLEEDIWIAKDYFAFHRAAHAQQHRAIGGLPDKVRATRQCSSSSLTMSLTLPRITPPRRCRTRTKCSR
jgi:hypothetical protein